VVGYLNKIINERGKSCRIILNFVPYVLLFTLLFLL